MMRLPIIISVITILNTGCTYSKTTPTNKIKDCPNEKIVNKMPNTDYNSVANEYYLYKGKRKEIKDFDAEWVNSNCPNIKVTEVQ